MSELNDYRLELIEKRLKAPMDATDGMANWLLHSHKDMRLLLDEYLALRERFLEVTDDRKRLRLILDKVAHSLKGPERSLSWEGWDLLPEVAETLRYTRDLVNKQLKQVQKALAQAMEEMRTDVCIECNTVWPKCRCPSGRWWRRGDALLEGFNDGGAPEEDREAGGGRGGGDAAGAGPESGLHPGGD